MRSLRAAIASAVDRNRVPLHYTDPPASILSITSLFDLPSPRSISRLIDVLTLPGNFMPGQPLGTLPKVSDADDYTYWARVFAIGLDGTPWIFTLGSGDDDGPWGNSVIENAGLMLSSAPVVPVSTLALWTPSFVENCVVMCDQTVEGHWNTWLLRIDGRGDGTRILSRSHLAVDAYYGMLAVDSEGRLQYFQRVDGDSGGTGDPLAGTPLSGPGFAPPGAPIAIDTRVVGLQDGVDVGGHLNAFVVDNQGALWVFDLDDSDIWSASRMPNPNGIALPPGAFIATGYQVSLYTVLAGTNSLGYSQLDVFVVDSNGNLQIWWESQGSEWHQTAMPDGGGLPPGAPIATGRQVFDEPWKNTFIGNQLDVFVVNNRGSLTRWWVYQSGGWTRDFLPDQIPLLPGSHLETVNQTRDDKLFQQLDVFAVGLDGRIVIFWQDGESPWVSATMPGSDLAVPPVPL